MRYAWISWFAAAVGFLASVPVLSDNPYTLQVLSLVGIYAIVAMATIGFGEIVKMLLVNWEQVTGGPAGISRIPHPEVVGIVFNSSVLKFYLVLGFVSGAFLVYFNLLRSHYGTRFVAVRDSAKAASAMGIDVKRAKVQAFVFSAGFAGVAGALYAHL